MLREYSVRASFITVVQERSWSGATAICPTLRRIEFGNAGASMSCEKRIRTVPVQSPSLLVSGDFKCKVQNIIVFVVNKETNG